MQLFVIDKTCSYHHSNMIFAGILCFHQQYQTTSK